MTPTDSSNAPSIEALRAELDADPQALCYAELAEALIDANQAAEAVEICQRGLGHHPADLRGLRALGRALMQLGRLQEAQTELLKALKADRNDAPAMLLIAEVLLSKADPRRAKTMLEHATRILGEDHADVVRLWKKVGGITGEVNLKPRAETPGPPVAQQPAPKQPAAARPKIGPLIGGAGAIINVEDDDVGGDLQAPSRSRLGSRQRAGRAGHIAWIVLLAILCVGAGATAWRMRSRAKAVEGAIEKSRRALRTGSLDRYRDAHAAVLVALKKDGNNPNLRAWLAKIEARMALEYMVQIKRLPAAIFAVEKIHTKLRRHPPGTLRRVQVTLGLSYRTSSWGAEELIEAQAIQQLLTGVKSGPGAKAMRKHTVKLLDDAVKKYPKALDLRYVRGLARLAAGDVDGAAGDLEETVKRDKDHVPAQLALAEVLLEKGQVVEAQERFNRVIGVNPNSMRARLGLIQTRLVRVAELPRVASELKKLEPGDKTPRLIRAWYRLARAWLFWAEGRLDKAADGLQHATGVLIPEARWLAWYIRLALLLGDVDKAHRPLVNGLAALRSADDPVVQAFGLEAQLNHGLPATVLSEGAKLLSKLKAGRPAALRTRLVLSRALLEAGKLASAVTALRALLKHKPEPADRPVAQIYLALAEGLAARAKAREAAATPKKGKPAEKKKAAASGEPPAVATARATLKKLTKSYYAPTARYALARLETDPARARKLLAGAVKNHRDAAQATVWLANLLLDAHKVAEARKQLESAWDRAPAYYPALRTRARLRLITGLVDQAVRDMTTLCYAGYRGKMPRGVLNRLSWTAGWSARLVRLDRGTTCPSSLITPRDLLERATIYIAMDSPDAFDSAWLHLAMAEKRGADPVRVGALRALALLAGQQTEERGKAAVALLEALVKAHPRAKKNAQVHYALGKAYNSMNEATDAVKSLQKAVRLRPDYLDALRSLGWLLLSGGKQVGAARAFHKAAGLAKRYGTDPIRVQSQLQYALGKTLMGKGKGRDLKQAYAALTEALRANGRLYQAAVDMARIDIALKRLESARKQLDDVLEADPNYADALLLKARLLGRSKDAKERKAGQALVKRLVVVAEREVTAGRADEGRYWLEQILRTIDKTHPRASLALGRLLARSPKEKKRARALLGQALKKGDADVKKRAKALLGKL